MKGYMHPYTCPHQQCSFRQGRGVKAASASQITSNWHTRVKALALLLFPSTTSPSLSLNHKSTLFEAFRVRASCEQGSKTRQGGKRGGRERQRGREPRESFRAGSLMTMLFMTVPGFIVSGSTVNLSTSASLNPRATYCRIDMRA